MQRLILIVLVVTMGGGCSQPDNVSTIEVTSPDGSLVRETTDSQSEAFLQEMVKEEHFSGVALVMRRGEIIHAKGYGGATSEKENTVNTVFHVGSITKQITATAIMQLVEAGSIDLDTSVNEYLPEQYRSPHWDNVTIHNLLSHTGGVPDYAVVRDYYDVVDGFCLGDTVDGMVKEAMSKALEFEPGSKYSYSNIGFTLLGFVIENQTSMPYEEYLRANVLDPMGMSSSRVHVIDHVPTTNEAAGHRWDEEQSAHVPDDIVSLPVTAPDGGLLTTLADFIKWTSIYMAEEPTILSRRSLERMASPAISTGRMNARGAPESYGYGLFIGDGLLSHGGYIVGFRSHFIMDRDQKLLIAVFSNNTTNDPIRISTGLLKIADETLP